LKDYNIIIIFLLIFIISVSGCANQNRKNIGIYNQNGISFNYPTDWKIANTSSPNALVAVADPKTMNPETGVPSAVVIIQKIGLSEGSTLTSFYDQNYANLFQNSSFQRISEGNITLNGMKAYENVYTKNQNGIQKQQTAIWVEKDQKVYIILYSALKPDFNKEKSNFDLITNSFKIL
jgi:hypothetical protein